MQESEPQKPDFNKLPISDRYEIDIEIGKGSYATVYRALDTSSDRFVALKIPFEGPPNSSARQQLQREMRALYDLDHPNIVSVLDAAVNEEHCYLAMEIVTGPDLKELTGNPHEAAKACYDIAQGLEHLHLKGFIHRDVKPGNILIDKDGTAQLSDFGCSKHIFVENDFSEMQYIKGTPRYMSPEQAMPGIKLDPSTDIYSLGIVLYQLLIGETPDSDASEDQIQELIRKRGRLNPKDLNPLIPDSINNICRKCLEPNKKDRYESAGHLARDLREFLHTGSVDVKLNPPAHRKWIAWSLALTAIVVILVAAAMKFSPLNEQVVQVPDGHKAEIYPESKEVVTFEKGDEKAIVHDSDKTFIELPATGKSWTIVATLPTNTQITAYKLDSESWKPDLSTKKQFADSEKIQLESGSYYLFIVKQEGDWIEAIRYVPRENDMTGLMLNGYAMKSVRKNGVIHVQPIQLLGTPTIWGEVEHNGFYIAEEPQKYLPGESRSFFVALEKAEKAGATIAPYDVLDSAFATGKLTKTDTTPEYTLCVDGYMNASGFNFPHVRLLFSADTAKPFGSRTNATFRLARRKKPFGE